MSYIGNAGECAPALALTPTLNAWVSFSHYNAMTAKVEQKTIRNGKGPKIFDTAAPLIPVLGELHVGGLP